MLLEGSLSEGNKLLKEPIIAVRYLWQSSAANKALDIELVPIVEMYRGHTEYQPNEIERLILAEDGPWRYSALQYALQMMGNPSYWEDWTYEQVQGGDFFKPKAKKDDTMMDCSIQKSDDTMKGIFHRVCEQV